MDAAGGVTVRVRLEIDLGSEGQAQRVHDALDVDSQGHARLEVQKARVLAHAEGAAGTVWRTMDDLLACLAVALGVEAGTEPADEA